MLKENEENPSLKINSEGEGEDFAAGDQESIVRNEDFNLSAEEEKIEKNSSFKPLNFPSEEKSPFDSEVSFRTSSEKTDSEKITLSEDFKNSEFFYENSLLTNAEDFAKSIREGANLYKSKLLSKIEQKVSDTERIHEQTISENKEAKLQREELLNSTKEKVDGIKKGAFQEGYDEGYKVGMQKRYDECESLSIQANTFLKQLSSLRKVVRLRAEKELVLLALKIAKNVVAEEIKLDDSVLKGIVSAALQETEMRGKIYLYLNPLDYEFMASSKCDLEKYLNDEQSLMVRKNTELKQGSIFVESDGEVICRSIESQFEKIESNLNKHIDRMDPDMYSKDMDQEDFDSIKNLDSLEKTVPRNLDEESSIEKKYQNIELEEDSNILAVSGEKGNSLNEEKTDNLGKEHLRNPSIGKVEEFEEGSDSNYYAEKEKASPLEETS